MVACARDAGAAAPEDLAVTLDDNVTATHNGLGFSPVSMSWVLPPSRLGSDGLPLGLQ